MLIGRGLVECVVDPVGWIQPAKVDRRTAEAKRRLEENDRVWSCDSRPHHARLSTNSRTAQRSASRSLLFAYRLNNWLLTSGL
jgi:hypothetical protein